MKTILLFFITSLILASCSCEQIIAPLETKEKDPMCTLIYMDFSSSQNAKSITKMIDKMSTIIENQPADQASRFVVKVIHKNNSQESIFDEKINALYKNFQEKKQHREKLEKVQVELEKKLTEYYQQSTSQKLVVQETCICNSLDNSREFLNGLNKNTEIRVIIFSDMFEECSAKSSYLKFDFYMCDYGYRSIDTAKINQRIRDQYVADFNLKSYVKPENLFFITTSNPNYNNVPARCLNPNEVRGIWKLLCTKLGYTEEEFNTKISYGNEVPERLLIKTE